MFITDQGVFSIGKHVLLHERELTQGEVMECDDERSAIRVKIDEEENTEWFGTNVETVELVD